MFVPFISFTGCYAMNDANLQGLTDGTYKVIYTTKQGSRGVDFKLGKL